MSDVSDLHNKMYKDSYDNGLAGPVNYLIRNFAIPRDQVINEYVIGGDALVDLGCGTGNFCRLAAPKFKQVHGLDFASESVETAESMQIPNATFQVFDLNQTPLPFEDNAIDTVVSIVTLDYVYNLNALVKEINRIMKNDGQFVFQVNNLGFLPRRIRLLLGRYPKISSVSNAEWPRISWDASACHLFVKRELSDFLTAFGFTVERVTGSGIFRRLRRWWPSLLCGDLIYVCRKSGSPQDTIAG